MKDPFGILVQKSYKSRVCLLSDHQLLSSFPAPVRGYQVPIFDFAGVYTEQFCIYLCLETCVLLVLLFKHR